MIKNERRDYQIAILGSLVFHVLLFLIYFPNGLKQPEMNLKTYPVGMVTLSSGSSGLESETQFQTQVFEKSPPQPGVKPENQPIREEPLKKVPDPPKTNPPERSIATADGPAADRPNSTGKAITPVPEGNSGGASGPTGAGSGSGGPRSLGNGEGKVFQLGPLPPYPKNALNEGIQGEVSLRVLVLSNGEMEKIELRNSSGDSRLDNAAQRAIKSWRFQPESEAYYIDIVFVFDLENGVSIRFIKAETRP
ncbi:MAG TPA: TonB family protein [Bacillota bacterium]|nr:TonB family protein [Bacillota bacterium]